jgi:hypothetical protein
MLHHAAVLLSRAPCRRHWLRATAWRLAHAWVYPPHWAPSHEIFVQWLLHHQIAVRFDRDVYAAGPAATEFANIPARLRVHYVGRLILAREGHDVGPINYFPGRTSKVQKHALTNHNLC